MLKYLSEPTWHIPSVSKVTSALRDSPSGRLVRQEVVDHVSPVKHGQCDNPYSSHSSSNTLSSNASSAHSDEKWYDTGDRTESELNGYNYIQGTSADSGIDTASYGPCHGSMLSAGTSAAATNSLRSAPPKEKASPWPGSNDSGMHCSRLGDRSSLNYERRGALSPAPSTESQSRCYGGLVHSTSSASAQESRTYSLSDTSSQSSTLSSRHSISPVVFTHSRSSPHDETRPTPSPQGSHHSSSTSGPRTFYPRQGATSKYLIGWKKPEGTTINSVGFVDTRKRHHSDVCEITQTRLRASVRDLRSPQRSSKSTIEDDLKKLINLESPPPDTGKDGKPSLPDTPTTRKPLHRTLSDESIYSGQREPSYCTSHLSLLDQALPNDVIFSSTYPSLHYTLPGLELSASDGSLSDIHERRRQPLSDPGLMPLPDTAMGLEWSNLVDAAKAFEVQRASLFGVDDSDHRPDSLSLDSSSQTDILSSPQAVSRRDESPTTLSVKVTELEMLLKELQDDLRRAKEDRAALQAEVQHLREDNLRLQEESQTASAQLKKFTEWVFNTIDMK